LQFIKRLHRKFFFLLYYIKKVGNLPFRRICKEMGADITCCEMAMSTNLLSAQASEWALLKRHMSEDVFGVQLAGAYPDTMTKACQLIKENLKVDFVDINCGCPIDIVFNKGAGCALMTRLDHFRKMVTSLDTLLDVPLTVKIRTGIKEDTFIAHELIPEIKNWGVSMITVISYSPIYIIHINSINKLLTQFNS
jgi:tRNA-dihydrouridine synthase 3